MATVQLKRNNTLNGSIATSPASLEVGELAINYKTGYESLFAKNDTGGIIALNDWANIRNKPASLPASDVYAWAKASVKPSYSWSEIGSKPTTLSAFTNDLGNYGNWITTSGSISGNAATATKLTTARSIWGQSFDGTANISGALSGVTSLTMSGALSGLTTITGNKGSAGTLLSLTDGVNSSFVVSTTSLVTTIGNGGGSTDLAFKTNNTEYMRIKSGGYVGIGYAPTDSLYHKLSVNGDALIAGGLNVDYGITTNEITNYGESFLYGNINAFGDMIISNSSPKLMLVDTELLTVSVASEVDGKLADFGTNYSQGGMRNAAYLGGYIRVDTRTEYPNSFFTVHSIPANGTDTTLFRIGTNGDAYIAGNLVVAGEISAYGAGSTGLDTAPASMSATGTAGERRFCSDGIYVCIAANTWRKSTYTTF